MNYQYWEKIDSIETERLILRQLQDSDAEDLFAIASDENTAYWAGLKPFEDMSEALDFIDCANYYADEPVWGITIKGSDKVIGIISLCYDMHGSHNESCVGYFISPQHEGNGYMTEALKAVCNFYYEKFPPYGLMCEIRADNIASRRVAIKCGFVQNENQTHWRLNYYDKPLDEFFYHKEQNSTNKES